MSFEDVKVFMCKSMNDFVLNFCKVFLITAFLFFPLRIHFDPLFDKFFAWCTMNIHIGMNCLDVLMIVLIIKMVMKVLGVKVYFEKRKPK